MALSYVPCDRDQVFLLPPDLREWLPAGHLVHLVLEVVEAMDTALLHRRHPNDGQGRRAYDPDMLLALVLYCACQRVESSRRIEQLCEVDVACRYICANLCPDHATIARFLKDNQDAFERIFAETLRLCAEAGMVKVGVVALDGTKIAANASLQANAGRDKLEAEAHAIVEAIVASDAADDARLGDARGDELSADLVDPKRRRDRLARLERCLEDIVEREATSQVPRDRRRSEAAEGRRVRGRRARPGSDAAVEQAEANLVAARVKADRRRRARVEAEAAADRAARKLRGTKPDFDRDVRDAEAALETAQQQRALLGSQAPAIKAAPQANVTDPDSRIMKSRVGWLQGYNAQAVVTADGVIVAAAVTNCADDTHEYVPMVTGACANLASVGVEDPIGTVLADAGYCSDTNLTAEGPPRLIATTKAHKLRQKLRDQHTPPSGPPPPGASPQAAMQHRLMTDEGAALYKLRSQTVEPVFGQMKEARGLRRFRRRGLAAVTSEWHFACTVHNTLKLLRHHQALRLA
jgi:transposase